MTCLCRGTEPTLPASSVWVLLLWRENDIVGHDHTHHLRVGLPWHGAPDPAKIPPMLGAREEQPGHQSDEGSRGDDKPPKPARQGRWAFPEKLRQAAYRAIAGQNGPVRPAIEAHADVALFLAKERERRGGRHAR